MATFSPWTLNNRTQSTLTFAADGKQVALPAGATYKAAQLPATVAVGRVQYNLTAPRNGAPAPLLPVAAVSNGAVAAVTDATSNVLSVVQIQAPAWQVAMACMLASGEACANGAYADITAPAMQPGSANRLYVLLFQGTLVLSNLTSAQMSRLEVDTIAYGGGAVADALVVMDPSGASPVAFGLNNPTPQLPPVFAYLTPAATLTVFSSNAADGSAWVATAAAPRNPSVVALGYSVHVNSPAASLGQLIIGTDPSNPANLAVYSQAATGSRQIARNGFMGGVRGLMGRTSSAGAPGAAAPVKGSTASCSSATTISLSVVAAALLVVAVVFVVLFVMQKKKHAGAPAPASRTAAGGTLRSLRRWGM